VAVAVTIRISNFTPMRVRYTSYASVSASIRTCHIPVEGTTAGLARGTAGVDFALAYTAHIIGARSHTAHEQAQAEMGVMVEVATHDNPHTQETQQQPLAAPPAQLDQWQQTAGKSTTPAMGQADEFLCCAGASMSSNIEITLHNLNNMPVSVLSLVCFSTLLLRSLLLLLPFLCAFTRVFSLRSPVDVLLSPVPQPVPIRALVTPANAVGALQITASVQ
jgi:hypothetical protein